MQKTSRKSVLLVTITILSLLVILSSIFTAPVKATPGIELYYDDGVAETSWTWPTAGAGMFVVMFTPSTSGQLLECSFYIRMNPATFIVSVFDLYDNEIEPFFVTPNSTGWFQVDVSEYGMPVSADVDFFVAMGTTVDYAPYLGTDTSDPDGRSWNFYSASEELEVYTEGDYMIRATIEPLPDLTITDLYWEPSEPEIGDEVTFYTKVENQGGGDANDFVLQLYVDGEFFAEGTDTLAAGENAVYTNTQPWEATGGEHTVRWILDPSDVINETDENNNEMNTTFTVGEYLAVVSPYGTPSGEGWYDKDTTVFATLDSDIVDYENGTRRVFTHWSGDASGTNYAQSDPIYMDGTKTATANWKTQYYLTMNADSGTVTPSSGWYDEGATVQISSTDPTATSGEQYSWLEWTGTGTGSYSGTGKSATVTMNSPITETAAWSHEYYLTVTSPYGTPTPESGWVEAGDHITVSVTSSVSGPAGTRYTCSGWTGTGSVATSGTTASTAVTMNEPSSITWSWKTQYYLTMNAENGTVTPSSDWYDEGATVQISATDPTGTADERYAWAGWTGTGTGSYSGTGKSATVTMNSPITETAAWRHEYYLTVTSPYGTPTPSSGWIEAGTSITVSANSPASGTSETRYLCTGWTGTGCVPASGTSGSASFTMDGTSSITWNWKTQYYLTMNAENGTVTPSSGWYDEGATVQISSTDPTATSGEQYSWLEWTGTGTGSYSGTGKSAIVTMNGPITETATWEYEVIRSSTSIHITLSSQKITEGETINVSGYITPAHEATITLTYRRADGLSSNNTVTSSSDGTFTQRYTPPEKGSWSVTASWLGDNNYYGSTSSTEQFTVEGFDWDKLQVILAVVGIAVSIILVGAAYYNSCRKRGKLKNLLDEIDEAFFRFKRNSRRCEAELYRLKDIVLEQYKSGIINEGSYVILNERIDDYISKLSQP